MRRGAGRAFVGFLLTIMLSVVLAGTCFGISLKTTVFSGDSFKDILKNMDLGSVMEEIVFESLDEAREEAKDDPDNELGSSGIKFAETILSEEVVSDFTDIVIEGLTEDKEVDFSVLKDGCMNALTEMSGQTVEDVIAEIQSTSNVVDAESLKNNSIIQEYQKEFNVDVTTVILEQMETVYGSKSVNLDEVDVEEVKAEAKEAVNKKVMPDIEKAVDEFIAETNIEVNQELEAIRVENDVESVTDIFNPIFGVILKSIIIGSIFAVILIGLQFLVYKKDINKAVKNVGIASLLVAISMFVCSLLCNLIADLASSSFDSGTAVDNGMVSIIDNTIAKIGGATRISAIVAAIVFVVLIIVAIILKKKFGSKEELHTTSNTFANSTVAAPAFNVVADQSSVNNMYGQQPMANNMYGQQPVANNMYGQQPVANDMYGQQPVANDMYGQQPMAKDMYANQTTTNDDFNNTQM